MGNACFASALTTADKADEKDWDTKFGRNVLGILASALIFIGVMLMTYAASSRIGQMLGVFASGGFLTAVGISVPAGRKIFELHS